MCFELLLHGIVCLFVRLFVCLFGGFFVCLVVYLPLVLGRYVLKPISLFPSFRSLFYMLVLRLILWLSDWPTNQKLMKPVKPSRMPLVLWKLQTSRLLCDKTISALQ